jgi:2-polyprenyl-6-methoxyphenol hydroxylase-like FAD-dependent oxidoreductase
MAPPAVALLRRLGVLDDVLAAGFRKITRHRTWVEDCTFEGPAGPPGAFSLAPRRNVLDPVLIDHARRAGAEFRQRTRADGLIEEDGRVAGAVLTEIGGERYEVRARVVVGADGKTSSVAGWVGAEKYRATPGIRPAYYGYFRGIEPRVEPTLEIWFGGDRIGFLFPMRPDEDCLALELQPEEFDVFRADPRGTFEERVRSLPEMKRRFAGAELEGKLIGVRSVDNHFRVPYGPGWVLTGDAAYLKDPSTGLGVGDALQQSLLLAGALDLWFQGESWESALGAFHKERDAAASPYFDMTLAFTAMRDPGPDESGVLKAILSSPTLTRSLTACVPGLAAGIYDAPTHQRIGKIGQMFAAAGNQAAAPAAAHPQEVLHAITAT